MVSSCDTFLGMDDFAALPSMYPQLVDQESNLADMALGRLGDLMALTQMQMGGASALAIGLGYVAAHKIDDEDLMNKIIYGAPVAGAALGYGQASGPLQGAMGVIGTEVIGGIIGHFAKNDFKAGATAGAVSALLYRLYTRMGS